ncbi:MAG TPA: YsnF/AvaK domain-containing protein [Acetobacteraceae bacterium]
MSGSYINNDTRSDALNDAASHDKGLYNPDTHDNQIVALYETMSEANKARDMLVHAGVSSESIQVMDKASDTMAGGVDYEAGNQGMWGAIKSLFVPDEEAHAYNHAISKGHAMVVVSPARSANREAIIHTLEATNPIDFDAKLEEWRQSGYDYQGSGNQGSGTASATVNRAASTPANYAVNQTTATDNIPASAGMASTAATMGASPTSAMAGSPSTPAAGTSATAASMSTAAGDTDTIKVMEERLRVGKREVATGAVRVRSYVVERPIEEQVSLHEERVHVERHPVDREVTAADAANAFQERTIEAQARSEEAVVQKDVRVIEEIGIRKDVSDRTETVHDTVRKTEVDVEDTSAATRPTGAATTTTSTEKGGSMGTGGTTTNSTAGATTSGMNAPRK